MSQTPWMQELHLLACVVSHLDKHGLQISTSIPGSTDQNSSLTWFLAPEMNWAPPVYAPESPICYVTLLNTRLPSLPPPSFPASCKVTPSYILSFLRTRLCLLLCCISGMYGWDRGGGWERLVKGEEGMSGLLQQTHSFSVLLFVSLSLCPSAALSLTHTLLLFAIIVEPTRSLPQTFRWAGTGVDQSTCHSCSGGGWRNGWEGPEQPSFNKSLKTLPLLPQKSPQSPSAGFCSVTTRQDLWAWNEWWDDDRKELTRLDPLVLTGVAAANRSSKSSNARPFWKRKGWRMRMEWMTHKWHGFMSLMMTASMVYTPTVSGGGSCCQHTVKALENVPSISRW